MAMQMAAQAARQGHGKLAKDLRELVDESKKRTESAINIKKTVHISRPRGELESLLAVNHPDTRLLDVVLPENTKNKFSRILLEQHQQHKLKEEGLSPRRRILFIGPPGTGKTLSASALANELSLPLCTIQLHVLITRYMGETAAKLGLIFDHIAKVRAVYLFDEFDAIGSDRQATNDIGEIRRVLNSFLQFLEQKDSAGSLIIGATNNPKLLDSALFRRFDDIITFENPSTHLAQRVIENRLANMSIKGLSLDQVISSAEGLSYAEIVKACDDSRKEAVLKDSKEITSDMLLSALSERTRINN